MSSSEPPYLGSKISIISKSQIRYEGILYTVDLKDSTIALAKVKSFGTENRPTERPLAPRDEIHEYIIFRASEIKDLHVCEPPKSFQPLDPAIVQAVPVMNYSSINQPYNAFYGLTGLQGFPSHLSNAYSGLQSLNSSHSVSNRQTALSSQHKGSTTDASVQVSVDGMDRIGRMPQRMDGREPLRQRNQMNYPQRRRPFTRGPGARQSSLTRRNQRGYGSNAENYDQEYDFEQANAEFQELENKLAKNSIDIVSPEQSPSGPEDHNSSYDKKKSFFDDISCEATQLSKGLMARFDWRLERKLNVETFGASANNAWLRRRRGRGNMRRGYRGGGGRSSFNSNRMNETTTKSVTFDEIPVVKEVEVVTVLEEDKADQLPVIEVVVDKEKVDWPAAETAGIWK